MIMNKIILLGRLTKDPDILMTSKETLIGKCTIAVPRKYVKEGEERKTDFINIVTFGNLTDFLGKFFRRGQQVLVCGRLEINQYEDENGESKYSTQVIAEELNFADSKKDDEKPVENFLDNQEQDNNSNNDDGLAF